MSSNKYKPHILVLPEDDANRQVANGFILNPALNVRAIQILPPPGGWLKVVDAFKNEQYYEMPKYPQRRVLMVIDFDGKAEERLDFIQNQIPPNLKDRTFVFGSFSDPEHLKTAMGKHFEDIGKALAQCCAKDTCTIWQHNLLIHNQTELNRMIASVKSFLFK